MCGLIDLRYVSCRRALRTFPSILIRPSTVYATPSTRHRPCASSWTASLSSSVTRTPSGLASFYWTLPSCWQQHLPGISGSQGQITLCIHTSEIPTSCNGTGFFFFFLQGVAAQMSLRNRCMSSATLLSEVIAPNISVLSFFISVLAFLCLFSTIPFNQFRLYTIVVSDQ